MEALLYNLPFEAAVAGKNNSVRNMALSKDPEISLDGAHHECRSSSPNENE